MESDDGDDEDREVDYMSSDSADDSDIGGFVLYFFAWRKTSIYFMQ